MNKSRKIYVNKSDQPTAVISRVIKAAEKTVILYIPRATLFAGSRNNFFLLKREAESAGKRVVIESVDEDVLELADLTGIQSVNPFLGRKRRAVSDIVVVGVRGQEKPIRVEAGGREEIAGEAEEVKEEAEPRPAKPSPRQPASLKRFFAGVLLVAVLATTAVFIILNLPRVKIHLVFEKTNIDFAGSLIVSSAFRENNVSNDVVKLRGVAFSEKRNLTKSYPSSGKKFVERKASGKIVIYNAYSAEPQTLVKSTRFVSPDGKVFRINETVTVPGATLVNGKINPSSIEATITADKAGAEYNIGPTRFRIPGFQGTPKYDGFYGETKEATSGGFVGEAKVATETDIQTAKADIEKSLEEALKTQLLVNLPPEIKVLPGAYEFQVKEERVNDVADKAGNFSITAYGEANLIGFRENELVEILGKQLMTGRQVDLKVENYAVDYANSKFNPQDKSLTADIKFRSVWTSNFDLAKFKQEAAGKDEASLKKLIFSLPGIQSAEVRFWPFWVGRAPTKLERIIVDAE